MNVQSYNSNNKNFGAIKLDYNGVVSKDAFDAIAKSKVLKKFGRDFNATATTRGFFSSKTNSSQISLELYDIKPLLKTRIKNALLGITANFPKSTIYLKTRATNEKEFVEAINNTRSNSLHKIYYDV